MIETILESIRLMYKVYKWTTQVTCLRNLAFISIYMLNFLANTSDLIHIFINPRRSELSET
jgi:hypothetical protein